ncbi:MAG: class I SAM-dependent methyltransferase [Solirubrobacteraceae bacterium]
MNYQRLYEWRFRDVDQDARGGVWREISQYIHGELGAPEKVLDPAAGRGEFVNNVPARERWAVDAVAYDEGTYDAGVRSIVSDIFDADLPADHFDGVWVSNFLEHLLTQEAVATFLEKMRDSLRAGGRIAIMGPNFRYCSREYFDCADHTLIFTHVAIEEHLYAAGFTPIRTVPRFLPYSFRGRLPPSAPLTRRYLQTPIAWRALGKQFLVVGERR